MRGNLKAAVDRACDVCGETYRPRQPSQRYCKPKCKNKAGGRLRTARNGSRVERNCYRCGETKPASEFGSSSQSYCKPCNNTYQREVTATLGPEQRAKRATKRKAEYHRVGREATRAAVRRWRWKRTPEQLAATLAAQGGRCGVCPRTEPGGRGAWHVDHDHACCPGNRSCGECVRGLLCHPCNLMLGHAKDNVAVLQAAIDYLSRPRITVMRD